MVAIEVPSDRFSSALGWLRHAYNAPDIDDDAVKAGVRDATLDGTLAQYESSRALRDALFAHLYAAGPAREPAVPPLSGTLPFTVGDVQAFARRAFRAANTILTTAGNTSVPSEVPAGVDAIADSVLGHSRIPGAVVGAALNGLAIGWPGPAISDARAATAMDFIGDYLFNPDTGILKDVAGLDGQFLTLHDPGVLVVTAPGDDAALRDRILAAVETMRSPLPVTAFEGARAAFIFHTLAEAQTPLARAETEGWYAAQGDSAYAPVDASGRYVAYAQGLNANDVAAVAKRYLHDPIVVRARISK